MVKNLPAVQETGVWSLGWEDPLEKEMATHSSIHAWRFHGRRSLASYSLQGHKESDMTEQLTYLKYNDLHFISFSCVTQWFNTFINYTPLKVIIKYWLYSLYCTVYPCVLLTLYIVVCISWKKKQYLKKIREGRKRIPVGDSWAI